ncbi:hypothetical protein ACLKA6_016695 [Drosophila palustris]
MADSLWFSNFRRVTPGHQQHQHLLALPLEPGSGAAAQRIYLFMLTKSNSGNGKVRARTLSLQSRRRRRRRGRANFNAANDVGTTTLQQPEQQPEHQLEPPTVANGLSLPAARWQVDSVILGKVFHGAVFRGRVEVVTAAF